MVSYLLIAAFSFLYLQYKIGLVNLLFLTEKNHQPISSLEFNSAEFVLILGIGASICLLLLIGVEANNLGFESTPALFNFISRTMEVHDRQHEILGGLLFSDYQSRPRGIADALRLQAASLFHALLKIVFLPLSVGLLHFIPLTIFAILLLFPMFILGHPVPVIWYAASFFFLYVFCYRALLFFTAKRKGITRWEDVLPPYRIGFGAARETMTQPVGTTGVTYDFILRLLAKEAILNAIKNDMQKTGQIGYKEIWRLGLITPDQDIFDLNPSSSTRQEGIKKIISDNNFRLNRVEQIPVNRTAVLFNATILDSQFNNLVVVGGTVKPMIGFYPGWSYPVTTGWKRGEFLPLRKIQMNPSSPSTKNRSRRLSEFLREDGFPLRESYSDGDPLTTDRGGIIVLDKEGLLIIYPRYFVQRRLIDDEGSLVDIGLDESFNPNPQFDVKLRPSVSELLFRYISANGFVPVLRYRSIPYASDYMIPIVDTPMSSNGWADLYVDTRGKAKLFISKEKTTAEWYEMMNKLKQLFVAELVKENHLLAFEKDKAHLDNYLYQKLMILRDYFTIRDWQII